MDVKHTFLFDESVWKISGYIFNKDEEAFIADGKFLVEHKEKIWKAESLIKTLDKNEMQINNKYEIIPFKEKGTAAGYTLLNPLYGNLKGSFLIQGKHILSLFESEKKKYAGSEYFIYVNDDCYRNRGMVFADDKKMFSWSLELKKNVTI